MGILARQLREQHDKDTKKATKVFTNDNLPAPVTRGGPQLRPAHLPKRIRQRRRNHFQTGHSPVLRGDQQQDQPESPEDKAKTRDYWQGKFKAARQDLAKAKRAATTCRR